MSGKKKHKPTDEMSFWEHLESLHWHFIRLIVFIITLTIVVFIYNDFIFNEIILALNHKN